MRLTALLALLVALALPSVVVAAESDAERDAWRSEIAAARARAETQRAALKAEFERRKVERLLHPPSAEDLERERARQLSEQVKNDDTLQKGDIVSTTDGLLIYRGTSPDTRTPDDFVPLHHGEQRR